MDPKRQHLGTIALENALTTHHFGAAWDFEFGGRSRDYGYWPRTREDVVHFFGQFILLAEEVGCSSHPVAAEVRNVLAGHIRGLWSNALMYDDLDRSCRNIANRAYWPKGWLAICQTIQHDSAEYAPDVLSRIEALRRAVQPVTLVQRVQSIVLEESALYAGIDATVGGSIDYEANYKQTHEIAVQLGQAAGADQGAFTTLLPELVTISTPQLWSFGYGLAVGTSDPRALWARLVATMAATASDKQCIPVFLGFLNALHAKDPTLAHGLLDAAVEDECLGRWYPPLQTAIGIDDRGVARLFRSLDLGRCPVQSYGVLAGAGAAHPIRGSDFNVLLKKIADKPEGLGVAMMILWMRIPYDGRRNS
jgi:hypothetical protein